MIRSLLRSIRKKPKATRDSIALAMAGTLTAVVFSVWLYNMPVRIAAIEERHKQPEEIDDSPSFSRLFSGVKDQLAGIKESLPKESPAVEEIELPLEDSTRNSTTSGSFAPESKYSWTNPENNGEVSESSGREVLITTTENPTSSAVTGSPSDR